MLLHSQLSELFGGSGALRVWGLYIHVRLGDTLTLAVSTLNTHAWQTDRLKQLLYSTLALEVTCN